MADDELKEFARLVEAMRAAQKNYFRTRDSESLENSKLLERKVDQEIKSILEVQPSLFKE